MKKIFLALILISQTSFAASIKIRVTDEMRRKFQIGSITLTEVPASAEEQVPQAIAAPMTESLGGAVAALTAADVAVDKIISIGTKIYNVIQAGQAVINTNLTAGNALPEGARHWTQLEFWKRSAVKYYTLDIKSLFGFQQIYAKFRISSLYGGSVGGVGQYLGYAQVEAEDVYVMWGFQLDSTAQVVQVYNRGSSSNPIAGITMALKTDIKNWLGQKQNLSIALYFDGNGRITAAGH